VTRDLLALVLALTASLATAQTSGVAIKDLGRIDGWRQNPMVGYGLVTGLAGTGDSARNRATRQSISNMLAQFGLYVPIDQVQSRNAAAVMVTASLPPFARAGDRVDVTVTSIGDAKSLLGGALLLTPLRGSDNQVRALAQGAIAVGGYQYELNGNVQQKNHPTTGVVPLGATIERGINTQSRPRARCASCSWSPITAWPTASPRRSTASSPGRRPPRATPRTSRSPCRRAGAW
jgi:flagellar P-ring protein precursor FlgI